MLETQISQLALQQEPTAALAGTFPGQPQLNSRGHDHAIILRSGTKLDGPTDPRIENPAMYQSIDKPTEKEDELKEKDKEDNDGEATKKEKPYVPPPSYKPPIPFPGRLTKSKSVSQFKRFVELLKQINITIPFTKEITQIPLYAKFLKEILSNKKKIEDNETVTLTAERSAII